MVSTERNEVSFYRLALEVDNLDVIYGQVGVMFTTGGDGQELRAVLSQPDAHVTRGPHDKPLLGHLPARVENRLLLLSPCNCS